MPIEYNEQTKQYEQDGEVIGSAVLYALIEKLLDNGRREAKRISNRLENGDITPDEWYDAMLDLLKASHLIAYSVGRGGLNQMSSDDFAKVENKVTWQSQYLPRFGRAIVAGTIVGAALKGRAGSYLEAPFVSFSNARMLAKSVDRETEMKCLREINSKEGCDSCQEYADMGWIPVSEQPELGELECGDWDKCTILFEDEIGMDRSELDAN